mmetsp:Transcript_13858/g.29586  ORF Transcript_13858/g.29586 Transcript_13858/m.29586 type:complete len:237 (-) Transcript_13858:2077-2787(-)
MVVARLAGTRARPEGVHKECTARRTPISGGSTQLAWASKGCAGPASAVGGGRHRSDRSIRRRSEMSSTRASEGGRAPGKGAGIPTYATRKAPGSEYVCCMAGEVQRLFNGPSTHSSTMASCAGDPAAFPMISIASHSAPRSINRTLPSWDNRSTISPIGVRCGASAAAASLATPRTPVQTFWRAVWLSFHCSEGPPSASWHTGIVSIREKRRSSSCGPASRCTRPTKRPKASSNRT